MWEKLVFFISCSLFGVPVFAGDINTDIQSAAADYFNVRNCDFKRPSLKCLEKLLTPLSKAKGLPFDRVAVGAAVNDFGPFVAPGWQITTLHRLPIANSVGAPLSACALSEFRFEPEPFSYPGCGTFLFIGGHPKISSCPNAGFPFACMNEIGIDEHPDIALRRSEAKVGMLPALATQSVEDAGEEVYLVHRPLFDWLPFDKQQSLRAKGLFVSKAMLLSARGRSATLLATVFQGSSGGTVLNKKGQVIGILSAASKSLPLGFAQIFDADMLHSIEIAKTLPGIRKSK